MKYLSLILGLICLIPTLCAGLLFDGVSPLALTMACVAIAVTAILGQIAASSRIKDAFKVSLPFFLTFNGIVEYILAWFLGDSVRDNWFFMAIVCLVFFQICMLVITSLVSKSNDGR